MVNVKTVPRFASRCSVRQSRRLAADAHECLRVLHQATRRAAAAVEAEVLPELLPLDVRRHRLAGDVGGQHAARAQPALVRRHRHAVRELLGDRRRTARCQRVGGAKDERVGALAVRRDDEEVARGRGLQRMRQEDEGIGRAEDARLAGGFQLRPRVAADALRSVRGGARVGHRETQLRYPRRRQLGPAQRGADCLRQVARDAVLIAEARIGDLEVALVVGAPEVRELLGDRRRAHQLGDRVLPAYRRADRTVPEPPTRAPSQAPRGGRPPRPPAGATGCRLAPHRTQRAPPPRPGARRAGEVGDGGGRAAGRSPWQPRSPPASRDTGRSCWRSTARRTGQGRRRPRRRARHRRPS